VRPLLTVSDIAAKDHATENWNWQGSTAVPLIHLEATLAKNTGRGSHMARRRRAGTNKAKNRAKTGARRGGSTATPRVAKRPANDASPGPRSGERSGVSKLAPVLKSSFLRRIMAAGLASAAAALLYRRSDRTASNERGAADDPVGAPATQRARPKAEAGDLVSADRVRTRKRRSDAGIKRPRKPVGSSATGTGGDQLIPELHAADTSGIALTADAGVPDELRDSPAEVETEAGRS
jgi:hypothetical protein